MDRTELSACIPDGGLNQVIFLPMTHEPSLGVCHLVPESASVEDGFLQGVAPTDAILPGRPYKSASIWHMWKGIKAPSIFGIQIFNCKDDKQTVALCVRAD
ncbi:hypothetical protein PCANC_06789 [Puccinia coronata f. sp. avenae]|uniref:Uncharacterized protein n=1 Tax=Puccinia coronata f. sp. avenae TaxID=200324 RepID=A0A2N5UUD6_9BASI|nr:hypothetical protein PCANC_07997 [Puccinia coronata f. sp. avenae]PLW41256.1 hypothetical protein PCANC_06789 [Puccinia coronata f. sp. avenae]